MGGRDVKFLEKGGDILRIALPTTAYMITFARHDSVGRTSFWQSLCVTLYATQGLKWLVKKERPNGDCCDGFPSGHTSVSFQGASFIQIRYGWKYGLPAYGCAVLVGYSRIGADKHDPYDVIAGAVLGCLSSYLFTRQAEKYYMGVTSTPEIVGIAVAYRW